MLHKSIEHRLLGVWLVVGETREKMSCIELFIENVNFFYMNQIHEKVEEGHIHIPIKTRYKIDIRKSVWLDGIPETPRRPNMTTITTHAMDAFADQRKHIHFETSDEDPEPELDMYQDDHSVSTEESEWLPETDATDTETETEKDGDAHQDVEDVHEYESETIENRMEGKVYPYPNIDTSNPMKIASHHQTYKNRRAFVDILVENTTPFVDLHYNELEVMYSLPTPNENTTRQIYFEYLLPCLSSAQYEKSYGIRAYGPHDLFYTYVNVMNMDASLPVKEHADMFVDSFYSLRTIQAFAVYACKDPRNFMISTNPKYDTQSYWMRIPYYAMTCSDAMALNRFIVRQTQQFGRDERFVYNTHDRTHKVFSPLLENLKKSTIGKLWYADELNAVH